MRLLFILIISIPFFLSSCKKIDKATQFDIIIEKQIEIPSLIGINLPFNIPTTEIHSNINEQLEIKKKKKKKIEELFLEELEISILTPLNKNFNFLRSIHVYIKAEGLTEILVAKSQNLTNQNLNKLLITPIEELDLTAYIKKDIIDLKVELITDETLFQKTSLNIKSTFWVDAKIMGI